MRYAKIREMDISNGEGIGVALFTQGCPHHCKNCFNQETWDYDGGKEWTVDVEDSFLKLLDRPFIKRVTFLGGEPMVYPEELVLLCKKIREKRPDIKIWLYSGYTYGEIRLNKQMCKTLDCIDILVDGRFIEGLKDVNLKFKGSSNQRIIDVHNDIVIGED